MKPVLIALLLIGTALSAQNRPGPPPPNPWSYGPGQNNWDSSWNNRPSPNRGACFYTGANFRGNKFCVRSGDRLPNLPGNFGNNISSIQVFGRGRVQVFNDRNFRGGNTVLGGNIPDLRNYRFKGGQNWNNRISSIIVS
jgi:peptidase inhibitor family I36